MNRALPLILLAVLIAGGLGYMATMGPGAPAPVADESVEVSDEARAQIEDTPRAEQSSTGSELASVSASRSAAQEVSTSGYARSWEIIPMNDAGQIQPGATITAKRGEEVRNAKGRTKWTTVAAGRWRVTVEAPDEPTWEADVVLATDAKVKTAVRLGHKIRIRGEVIDTNGAAVARTAVFLLPEGVSHPSRADIQTRAPQSREPANALNGAIAESTDASGRFSITLPESGKWRVSVGKPGEPRWTQRKGTELANGGPDRLVATVPALAQLTLRFDGTRADRPTQVSAYSFDADLAARMASQRIERETERAASSVEDAQRRAKSEAMRDPGKRGGDSAPLRAGKGKGGRSGTARPSHVENEFIAENGFENAGKSRGGNAPLFQPGWRPVRSVRITGEETVFNDLPGGEELRFLFVRGRERLTTSSTTRLKNARRSIAQVTLPPPPIAGGTPSDQSGLTTMSVDLVKEDEANKPKAGAVWTRAQ